MLRNTKFKAFHVPSLSLKGSLIIDFPTSTKSPLIVRPLIERFNHGHINGTSDWNGTLRYDGVNFLSCIIYRCSLFKWHLYYRRWNRETSEGVETTTRGDLGFTEQEKGIECFEVLCRALNTNYKLLVNLLSRICRILNFHLQCFCKRESLWN